MCYLGRNIKSEKEFRTVCDTEETLVICDEHHHHAAVSAAWGESAGSAFENAKFVLILTGTPIRSDKGETVWLTYNDQGKLNQPSEGMYTLDYGQAVELGYCRPVTFHRHEGDFTVSCDGTRWYKGKWVCGANNSKCIEKYPRT